MFHCLAGKDRTGLLAALVLEVLGVDRSAVLDDYEHSATAMPHLHTLLIGSDPTRADDIRALASVLAAAPRAALESALEWLDINHGGARAYLIAAGVRPNVVSALRTLLLV